MKKILIVITIIIYSFLSINLLFAATFTQADLTGTWRLNALRTGYQSDGVTPRNEWARGRFTINSSGVASCLSYSESSGVAACPVPFDLTYTMDETTGVITQSGTSAPNAGTNHMTMSLNKNFAAGTATRGSGPGYSYGLSIAQKEVAGTIYRATDLENKSFVYHQLEVGNDPGWSYGAGTIDATGLVTISSMTNSWGDGTPGTAGTMSVDGNGVVTRDNDTSFQGFLSDDKKTIVGTNNSDGSGSPQLVIVQITGRIYSAGTMHASTDAVHTLGCGSSAFWIHYTNIVDNSGVITYPPSEWVASNPGITVPVTTPTGYVDASGTITLDIIPTYHGQVSDDIAFTVGTRTGGTNPHFSYMLSVSMKSTSDMVLYGRFTGGGIWKWEGSAWSRLTPNDPTDIIWASGYKLYGSFGPGAGIWMYDEISSIWSQITPNSPLGMAVTSGSILYGNFGPGAGIWKWDGSTWSQITPNSPTSMAGSASLLYGNFGPGAGIWKWDGSTWSQITPNSPTSMTASGSLLYGNFGPGAGIWKWDGSTWSQITPNSPTSMRASSWLLYGAFTGAGIWKWDGSAWSQVTPNDPQHNMVCMYHELYADFSGYGIWTWDSSVWSRVTPNDPASMVTGYGK